jgi:hypothetical protein
MLMLQFLTTRTQTNQPDRRSSALRLWCPRRAVWTLRLLALLLLLGLGVALLGPTPANAQARTCSSILPFTNVAACLDGVKYTATRTGAALVWIVPRALLVATYYLGMLRGFLVGSLFTNVYGALIPIMREVLVGRGQDVLQCFLLCQRLIHRHVARQQAIQQRVLFVGQ